MTTCSTFPENMTRVQVAGYLQVSPRTVERMTQDGQIPVVWVRGCPRYLKRRIDAWLERQTRRGMRSRRFRAA